MVFCNAVRKRLDNKSQSAHNLTMLTRQTANGFALIGTVLLQCSAVPAIVQALQGGETAPIATLILIVLGLLACAITEIHYKLWAYLVGSIIGLSGHIAIIAIVLARGH
jgi:hypothetical protein